MNTTRVNLDSRWQVQALVPAEANPALRLPQMPAEVPGCIHLDLQRAGIVPDPFNRLYERTVAWVDDTDWIYQTTFRLDSMPDGDVYFHFLGLDTIAEISLNGHDLGRTDNMFVDHEFDIRSLVQPGENTLAVSFRSARRVGRERLAEWAQRHEAPPVDAFLWDARSFVRKAQYMFGWDWGPVLISCGIWRPIELVHVPIARILRWHYDVSFDQRRAVVRIEVNVERAAGAYDAPLSVLATIAGAEPAEVRVPAGAGELALAIEIHLANPRRWSPHDPALYSLDLHMLSGQTEIDSRQARIGLRTIELLRKPDPDGNGEGFVFLINGEPLFCKGANWIPADSFPSRSYEDPGRLRPLLEAAREEGCNMLRVWGGGMYESDAFYDLCDELGILVWQDFPYACAYYPDDALTLQSAGDEARKAVRRLRVHPSLALWCGNNENYPMFVDDWHGLKPPRFLGEAIYESVLPQIVAEENPATPYWPGSAYGGKDPNSADYGDRHNWDVWHGEGVEGGDWTHYTEDRSRFCSEFGFASSCGLAAWNSCLAPADRRPDSLAVRWHDKTLKPDEVYIGYIERHLPPVRSLVDLVYYSQINQAEAMRCGVEHYRRIKGRCWGTLIWQLNDCWPVQSWSMIDSLGERKAAHYAAKRFYAPVLLSAVRHPDLVEIHLTSDLGVPLSGEVVVRLVYFDGTVLREERTPVSLRGNATGIAGYLSLAGLGVDCRDIYVHAVLRSGDPSIDAEAVSFLAEPRDLRLPDPQIHVTINDSARGQAVTLEARRFAAYVWLTAPDLPGLHWSDNFFHLRAGESRTVIVTLPDHADIRDLGRTLTVRTLNDSLPFARGDV